MGNPVQTDNTAVCYWGDVANYALTTAAGGQLKRCPGKNGETCGKEGASMQLYFNGRLYDSTQSSVMASPDWVLGSTSLLSGALLLAAGLLSCPRPT